MKGRRFGRLLVQGVGCPYVFPATGYTKPRWRCVCDCGKIKDVREDVLLKGESKSCGCLARENVSIRNKTHGLSRHPIYNVWMGMLGRCNDSRRKDYKHYGGRGIKVCERWLGDEGLTNFIQDMYETYAEGLEIERKDVNGDYSPDNCTWATRREQVINRRPTDSNFSTHFLTFDGKTLCISQWADELKIPRTVIVDRIGKLQWSVEDALTIPLRPKRISVTMFDSTFLHEDIFSSPPNNYVRANKKGLPVFQYLANLFNGIGVVTIEMGKQNKTIKPTGDFSNELKAKWLNPEIKAFLASKGVDIG